jgi:membrane fusion protein (multidrug efflux system)
VLLTDSQASVFVIKDEKAVLRNVELGQRDVGRVEVKTGLQEGERIAVTGLQRLRPGSSVEVVDSDMPVAPDEPADGSAKAGSA